MKRPGMRVLGFICGTLLGIALAGGLIWKFGAADFLAGVRGTADQEKMAFVAQSSVSIAYRAQPDRWLTFPVASGTTRFKLIANASLAAFETAREARRADPTRRWSYALEIEVLDRSDRTLLKRTHHQRTDIAEFVAADGRRHTPAFYLREALTPLGGVIVNLDLGVLPDAQRIRIRLARKDDDIADVVVRAYQPERITPERAALLWQRLNERQREALARGSVYPHELLHEAERRNLLLNSWQALGPQGAEGRDYHPRDLYVLLDADGTSASEAALPHGVLADAWNRGTLPLPEEGGRLKLDIIPTGRVVSAPASGTKPEIVLRWFGRTVFERREIRLPWTGDRLEHEFELPGGLLEFEAPQEVAVHATRRAAGKDEDLTPTPQYLRVFVATGDSPVTYSLAETGADNAFRVELRTATLPGRMPPANARWRFANREGNTLATGDIALDRPGSRYERRLGDYSGAIVSDVRVAHFRVPADATRFEVTAASGEGQLLVSAHTRPDSLVRTLRAPEDSYDFNARPEKIAGARIPAWFPLRPDHFEARLLDNRSQVLAMQARPTEDRPEIRAGLYQWEDYRPEGAWLARALFAAREPGIPEREEALPGTFSPLPVGEAVTLAFPAVRGNTVLRPRLLWLGPPTPATVQISIDGRPAEVRVAGPTAEATLPPLAVGEHRIHLHGADGGRVFISHARPRPGALVRHVAQRVTGRLDFIYERRAAAVENVALRFFQLAGPARRQTLSIRVEGPPTPPMRPSDYWEFAEREVSIRSGASPPAYPVGAGNEVCDSGEAVYLPFPADAPPGRYRITVTPPPGARGYLTVSRLTPALAPERQIHLQAELPDASKP